MKLIYNITIIGDSVLTLEEISHLLRGDDKYDVSRGYNPLDKHIVL